MSDLPSPQENANARTKALRLHAENARLQAENERLRKLGIKLESMIDPLQAEVERLRKAIMDSVEMRQRLREIEEGKPSV